MARAQQQGGGYIIGMIVFGMLWAVTMVFLVILYTDQEELRNSRNSALAAKSRAISSAEERSIALAKEAREGGPTVARLLEDARSQTAELAVGDPTADTAAIRARRDELTRKIKAQLQRMAATDGSLAAEAAKFEGVSMFEGFEGVFRLLEREYDLRVDATKRADDLSARLDQAIVENTAQKADFDKQAAAMQTQLEDVERSRQQYRTDRDARIAELETQYDELRNDCTTTITDARKEKTAWERRYNEVLNRYTELQSKLGTLQVSPQKLATSRNPDGRILKAVPGDDAVYINLGRRDALILGMEFAVYSGKTSIPADGRAKASVRVESISANSAECKVLWVDPHEIVLEGDLIANPVYDRDRTLTFLVVGEFDVDRDGDIDRDGAARIEALITNWGGRVVDDLTALTDFVVVGATPRKAKTAGDVSADMAARNEAVQRRYDRYQAVVDSARTLSIPMLTQEVFKNFLGYRPGGTYLGRR